MHVKNMPKQVILWPVLKFLYRFGTSAYYTIQLVGQLLEQLRTDFLTSSITIRLWQFWDDMTDDATKSTYFAGL